MVEFILTMGGLMVAMACIAVDAWTQGGPPGVLA